MSDMYNCPNCGAPIDGSGTCKYCGTRYGKNTEEVFVIREAVCPIEQLGRKIKIPFEATQYLSEEEITGYAIRHLAEKFSEDIAKRMEVKINYDPRDMSIGVLGRIGVARMKE